MDSRTAAQIERLYRLEKRALAHRERGRLSGKQALMRRAITLELAVRERLNALSPTGKTGAGLARPWSRHSAID